MQQTSVRNGPPFPCLRVLVPPLRLVSAAIWQTVQQRIVTDYGLLDDLITEITEIVPDLLNQRQKCLLCLNLRAQLILELCHSGRMVDLDTIQPHIDRMQTLTLLLNTEANNPDEGMTGPNILSLIQILIKDQDDGQHFYRDVFPMKYGPKFNKAIELLVMKFLLGLERLLAVPNLQQVASMLNRVPSVLAECVELPLPTEMKSLLEYQKDYIKPSDIDYQSDGDSICLASTFQSKETILKDELETLLEANVFNHYKTSAKDMPTAMATGEDGHVKVSEGTDGDYMSEGWRSAGINTCMTGSAAKAMQRRSTDEDLNNTSRSNVAPASNEQAPRLEPRPVRKNGGLKMKSFLTTTKAEPGDENGKLSAGKTCPTCGKTYSRASDARRHQRTHTGEKCFQCPQCQRSFRFQYKLKRRNSDVCRAAIQQTRTESPQTPDEKTADEPSKAIGHIMAQDCKKTNPVSPTTAPYSCGTCESTLMCESSHEEVCPVRQQERSYGKETPQVLKDDKSAKLHMERLVLSLVQGDPADDGNEGQEKKTKTIQGSGSAGKCIKPIPDGLIEAASVESNSCAKEDPQLIKPTEIHETNSHICHVGGTTRSDSKSPPDAPPYFCPNCEVKFKSKSALKRHMVTACKVEKIDPAEADSAIRENEKLKENKCSKRESKPADSTLYCAECNKCYPDMATLQTHNLIHKPCVCTMCDRSFNGLSELNQHYVDVHNFHGPFPCTFCDRVYTDLKGLTRHERVHTGDLPFQCPKCPKSFGYAFALKRHDRTHTKETPFLCWDCGKGCKSNGALRIHRLCCHSSIEEKHFSCEHCGKAYALKRSLDLHVAKLHAGVRYPCAHCGKLFRSASSLTRHDLTHTQERPYLCKECGKSFRSASELKIHIRYHTGERPFKCQECGKGFVQSYYLTAHMRMHTGEKPYQCPTCDKCFKSAGILKRHRMTHTGEKPHKCAVCDMAFSRHELLKSHMRQIH